MSRSWLWDQKDDQKVVAWTAKASEDVVSPVNPTFLKCCFLLVLDGL
jgi:hypothetical protein